MTLDKIKMNLKEKGIFDWQDPALSASERKQLNRLFEAIEIMVNILKTSQLQNTEETLDVSRQIITPAFSFTLVIR